MATPTQLSEKRGPFSTSLQAVETRTRGDEGIPVLLVDSRPLTREWLAKWLEEVLGVFHVTTVAGAENVGDEERRAEAELTILNVGPAAVSDHEITDEIGLLRSRFPDVPIVLFAEREEIAQVAAALRQGVRGYITSNSKPRGGDRGASARPVRWHVCSGQRSPAGSSAQGSPGAGAGVAGWRQEAGRFYPARVGGP